ncbi:Zn2Cys6 transcriptional regulator protein [Rutstroemia sp. NJR-2017a WRK4]|nr:Zn2Cys6 transcriptional regulator protein [Rutstroemia sp. NJR-2017a WRK4]
MSVTSQAMNACVFCKHAKRKCDKARPACSNCARLGRSCVYAEDNVRTSFADNHWQGIPLLGSCKRPNLPLADCLSGVDPSSHDSLQQSTVDMVMRIFGSLSSVATISGEFFIGTHQRIPTISRLRFEENLLTLTTRPRADFAVLCLTILLLQQMPLGKETNMQSPLYFTVKNLITLLETKSNPYLDLMHCRVLVTFYEVGHGFHREAYVSLAGCARAGRGLGLHKKPWRNLDADSDRLALEEEKRTWWEIVLIDRFINLYNKDTFFVTGDPERTEPLPIEDLLWSESSSHADLQSHIDAAPSLDTPFNITVGQLARECQISHLVGHVVRHVFDPVLDPGFNTEEAVQLERTLRAYLPLLSNEELKIGKYCGAYGMCNRYAMLWLSTLRSTKLLSNKHSSLFILYEYMLSRNPDNASERRRVQRSIEETAFGALNFAAAAYADQEGNYPTDVFSPYLPHSLYQAAILYHRLWTQRGHIVYKQRLDKLKAIIGNLTKRWMIAWHYLEAIDKLDQ